MAIPIAPTPVLSGKEAAAFISQMYDTTKKSTGVVPTPKIAQAIKLIQANATSKK